MKASAMRTHPSVDFDQIGREVRIAITRWHYFGNQADEQAQEAGRLLIQVKSTIGHGNWESWLSRHQIEPRTAQRLMDEHRHPEKKDQRQTRQKERNASAKAHRAQAKADVKSDMHGAFDGVAHLEVERKRKHIIDYVRAATKEQIACVYDAIADTLRNSTTRNS